jgi:hypothetical protein
MKKASRPVSIFVVGSSIMFDLCQTGNEKTLTPAAIKIEPLAAARVPVSPVYSIPARDVERLRLAGSTRKDPPLDTKPNRFSLQRAPLDVLCGDLAMSYDDAAEILDISYAHVKFYVEHTCEFTPEAWLEIVSILMANAATQRTSITIFDFLDDEDAAIVRKAFETGDEA